MSSALFKIVQTNGTVFSDSKRNDIILYTKDPSQAILMGSKKTDSNGAPLPSSISILSSSSSPKTEFHTPVQMDQTLDVQDDVIITNGGSLGIGTSNVDSNSILHVLGNVLVQEGDITSSVGGSVVKMRDAFVGATDNGSNITFTRGNGNEIVIPLNESDGLIEKAGSSVIISNNESLGVGTSNVDSNSILHVVGDVLVQEGDITSSVGGSVVKMRDAFVEAADNGSNITFTRGNGNEVVVPIQAPQDLIKKVTDIEEKIVVGNEPILAFNTSNVERMTIQNDGFVGIGTSNPTMNLHVIGNILASEDIVAESDSRVKEDIQRVQNAFEKVRQLNGYTYRLKGGKDRRSMGVIAQELLNVIPEVVHHDSVSDRYSVAYGNMFGLFIEAFNDLANEVEVLKKKVEGI